MSTAFLRTLGVLVSVLLVGCAARYRYAPETGVTAAMPDGATGEYPVPPGAPRGVVRVASVGVVDVPGERGRGLQVTFVIVNRSDREWSFDTREQHLALDRRPESAPVFASTAARTPYLVTIPPGGEQIVDLFFALPPNVRADADLAAFDVVWLLDAGGDLVAQRTPFGRHQLPVTMEDW